MTQKEQPFYFRVFKAPAAALSCSTVEKFVLLSFIDRMNPELNGTLSWPSAETIAEQHSMNERTVRRAIKTLCENDLLKHQQRTGRYNVYAVNVGLIHRLIQTGHKVRSESADRTQSPVRPGRESGQTGQRVHSDRTESPANTQGTPNELPTTPISPIGVSADSKAVPDDPVQRRLALHQVVAGAADRMRFPSRETPIEKKTDEAQDEIGGLADGAPRVRERPG